MSPAELSVMLARLISVPMILAVVLGSPAAAQDLIKVKVFVEEDRSDFTGALTSALLSLGDIEVLGTEEPGEDVRIRLIAKCLEGDGACNSWAVASILAQPVTGSYLMGQAIWAIPDTALQRAAFEAYAIGPNRDKWHRVADQKLSIYENTRARSVAGWGKDRYEEAIRDQVRRWDTTCFGGIRLNRGLWAARLRGDTTTGLAIAREQYARTDLICQ
jgi:hypothetical protein